MMRTRRMGMNDFGVKLVEAIAARIIDGDSLDKIKLPEPFGIVRWTGWKSSYVNIEFHAQIVWLMPGKDHLFYVDLPSMRHGKSRRGEPFDVSMMHDSSHHIDEFTTLDDLRRWFVEGFGLLLTDVINESDWLTMPPTRR
jgi:hypothetical protein